MDSNLKIMKNPEKTSNPHKYSNEHPSHKYKVKVTEKQDGGEWKKNQIVGRSYTQVLHYRRWMLVQPTATNNKVKNRINLVNTPYIYRNP